MYSPAITLVGNLAIGAVLLYGGLRVIDGDMKVGVLATFLLYLERFFDPLQDLSQFYNTFQSAAAALEKISGVLDEPPAVPEPAHPVPLPPSPGRRPAADRGGREVRFEAVRFGYRDKPVLPGLRSDHPGRADRGRWSARPGPARPPWPGCWPGSTTRAQGTVRLDGVDLRRAVRACAARARSS